MPDPVEWLTQEFGSNWPITLGLDLGLLAAGWLLGSVFASKARRWLLQTGAVQFLQPPWPPIPVSTAETAVVPPTAATPDSADPATAPPRPNLSPGERLGLRIVGTAVRAVFLLAAVWGIARAHNFIGLMDSVVFVTTRGGLIFAAVAVSWAVGRLAAAATIRLFENRSVQHALNSRWPERTADGESFALSLARLAAIVVLGIVMLPGLVAAFELLGAPRAGDVLAQAWSLVVKLVTAGIILASGWFFWLVLRRKREGEDPPTTTETLMALTTTGLALVVLAGGGWGTGAAAIGSSWILQLLLALVILGLCWPAIRYLPDLWAGLYLRGYRLIKTQVDGRPAALTHVGLLTSRFEGDDETWDIPNREALEAVRSRRSTRRERTSYPSPLRNPYPERAIATPRESPAAPTPAPSPYTSRTPEPIPIVDDVLPTPIVHNAGTAYADEPLPALPDPANTPRSPNYPDRL